MKYHLLVLPLLLLSAAAQTATRLDAKACNPESSQMQLNACAALRLSAADDELSATWKEVIASLAGSPVSIEKLKSAQRLWLTLRDADMDARFPLEEGQNPRVQYGSIYPMEWADAKAGLTRERTRYLRANWLDATEH